MIRIPSLAAIAIAGAALASPVFAFSVNPTPANTPAGAKLVDPDEVLSGAFKNLVGSAEPTVREAPTLRGPTVTYDLSKGAKTAKSHDGFADLAANPGDPRFNPFSGESPREERARQSH